ncbi:inositol monophosphatase [Candidatus Peregrinibacteria bacterium]|jgi:myo-inositol-1(or 4)-monophosphatase|nr:inositol monophosphatase [Candidatus Peregrinibacteria bacterium]MBT7702743.1 inositol monophosphatase [Candidatus Peregrinibacteria bacterium]
MKNVALKAAKQAGDYLLSNFRKDPKLMLKRGSAKDVVTKYDKESDQMIRREIEAIFPDHNLVTEEGGEFDRNSEYTWLVDSLDGTGNFAVGNPFFAVSIGVMKGKELVLGVIYAPYLNELYVAEKGKGAYLNGQKLTVSEVAMLKDSYVTSCEGGDSERKQLNPINSRLYPKVQDLRKLGSAALECAWVASGRAEAYFTTKICNYDVAAGVLLVEEAGGKVSDFEGRWWQPIQDGFLFSNELVHEELLQVVKGAL